MNKILVNALSVTNQSGLHVLAGHVNQLAGNFHVTVLGRPSMRELKRQLGGRADWMDAPERTARWWARSVWEFKALGDAVRHAGADVYFTPSGMAAYRLRIPQVVFCQNPWALVPEARRSRDALKAWLQRRAYRRSMRTAAVMVFNSRFMQRAYRQNAGKPERKGLVVSQAADEETRRRAQRWRDTPRSPGRILCVSVMGPHKNVESLVRAFARLDPGASLELVGSWPDASYEREIRNLVEELDLSSRIHFAGFVSREELDRLYAESQVFCLMSRCESFGIPSIEAQLFGTPVVCSHVCAVPEICGDGGMFADPDDVDGIAAALKRMLTDAGEWQRLSALACRNAEKYNWKDCSRPLVDLFAELLAPGSGGARKIPLSAVILCRNEAVNLERCIQALRGVAEIVVLDDGSTDGSRDLAQSLGVRVVEHRFVSFADQRNWAMEHAGLAHDWVLHLDADEVMTPAALHELAAVLPSMQADQVGWMARKVMLGERWLRFSADYPVYVARLIHRRGPRFIMQGHGEIIDAPSASALYLREPMLHYAWSKGWQDWRERHWRYAAAEAERLRQEGASVALRDLFGRHRGRRRRVLRMLSFHVPFRPAFRFLYAGLLRGGLLDGRAGLRFCLAMAHYERMISVCVRRLQTGNKDDPQDGSQVPEPTGEHRP